MSDFQRRRLPAIRCWIKHLREGQFMDERNMLNTIFGSIKRVRIMGTIVEKKLKAINQMSNNTTPQYNNEISNTRVEFELDDATGLVRANIWGTNPKSHKELNKGDLVDIVGLINYKYDNLSISTEIIKKIVNPNELLLRNAEIIKKIKFGKINVFQETEHEKSNIDLLLFEQPTNGIDQFKEKVFSIIDNFSQSGNGISFIDLFNKIEISEDKLRRYIRDLEMESKIYQSEENFYQTY
ncbi:MAG: hypothetical protein ACXACC_07310 [Promethearchaeota archaeon]|jgi:RPA family protein